MNLWHDIETGPNVPDVINTIIEIPRGSQNKFEYDKKHNLMRLDRVLFSPFHYPGDYGIIPQTLADDGDPLDALVMITNPTYPGILIEARPVGVLKMTDNNESDEKILCVATDDPRYRHTNNISDIDEHILKEIAHFFQVYKDLEGKKVEIDGWESSEKAKSMIQNSVAKYKETFKK